MRHRNAAYSRSTVEARNSSSQVRMNDVTEQKEGALPSLVVYSTSSHSQCLWMNDSQGLNDIWDWQSRDSQWVDMAGWDDGISFIISWMHTKWLKTPNFSFALTFDPRRDKCAHRSFLHAPSVKSWTDQQNNNILYSIQYKYFMISSNPQKETICK